MERTNLQQYLELSGEEKQKIQDDAQELARLLEIWASCYPVLRARRIPPVSVLVATVLPGMRLPVSLLVGKLILFIFAVDDLIDERLLSYKEFRQASKAWQEIALWGQANSPVEQDCGLSAILYEIRADLAKYSLFADLGPLWAERLGQLCDAMAQEVSFGMRFKASGGEKLPALDAFVAGGIHSVGFPFWGTSVLILLSEPAVLDAIAEINVMIMQAGAAIRLYNDARTYEKEIREENINAVTLFLRSLMRNAQVLSGAERTALAKELVVQLADQHAEKCCTLAGTQRTTSGRFERMIRRIVAFHASFYASRKHNYDYHTITPEESFSMIQGAI